MSAHWLSEGLAQPGPVLLAKSIRPTREGWTRIQPDGDAFVGEIAAFAWDLVGVGEPGAVIHCAPRFDAGRSGAPGVALGQTREEGVVNR